MLRLNPFFILSLLALWQIGCGGGSPSAKPGSGPGPVPTVNISISPTNTAIGSPDTTLTVTGSKQFQFTDDPLKFNQVVWSANNTDTQLVTTFVSSSQLTAVIPSTLLTNPVKAMVHVEIWDDQGVLEATSSSVRFNVFVPPPTISSISPDSVPAGSSDVTLAITGSNFYDLFLNESIAFWTTCENLHDCGTMLDTAVVSHSELKATIPAALLQSSGSAQIVVLTGDSMGMSDGFFGYPRSNSVTFTVTP